MNTDSAIMLRRNFKHILRNPFTIINGALMPVLARARPTGTLV